MEEQREQMKILHITDLHIGGKQGMAITPHLDFIPVGFQIVDLKDDGNVETMMYVYKEGHGVAEVTAW